MDPQPSREYAALAAGQELAAYAFIRAWMADDVDKGMLLIEQHHLPKEAALFVMSLVKAARRALLSAEGYMLVVPRTVPRNRTKTFDLSAPTWEPPIGIEPMTYALRVRRG